LLGLQDAGALASSSAAEIYGLNILAEDIQVCVNGIGVLTCSWKFWFAVDLIANRFAFAG